VVLYFEARRKSIAPGVHTDEFGAIFKLNIPCNSNEVQFKITTIYVGVCVYDIYDIYDIYICQVLPLQIYWFLSWRGRNENENKLSKKQYTELNQPLQTNV
jgi:hypothetical protein